MKKVVFVMAVILGLASCSQQKSLVSTLPLENLPKEIKFSPSFRIFWEEMKTETAGLSKITKFKPTDEFCDKYSIRKEGKVYAISGFLTVNEKFNVEKFKSLGGTLVKFTDTKYTFMFPLRSVDRLFDVEGIRAIELARKVQTK